MKSLLTQIGWQFLILHKNKLIAISVVITFLYGLIFYLIKDLPNVEPFLTLLIYNDPAIIGMFFIGLSVIMEKDDNVLPALFVTPINYHTYLISRIIALSTIGLLCATGMAVTMLGIHINWLHFSIGVLSTCVIFSIAGVFVVSYTTEFLNFMLRAIPVMIFLSLPLFNYFGLTDMVLFEFTPIHGPLLLTINSFHSTASNTGILFGYASTLFWIPVLYLGVYKLFVKKVVKSN